MSFQRGISVSGYDEYGSDLKTVLVGLQGLISTDVEYISVSPPDKMPKRND